MAATVLPFYSEFAVAAAIGGGANAIMVVAVASGGNTAGACVNWLLGRGIERFRGHRWFPVVGCDFDRAQLWFQRFGVWTLLLTWLPIGGDALTVVAGVMRVPFSVFVVLTGIGKTARYVVLVFALDRYLV